MEQNKIARWVLSYISILLLTGYSFGQDMPKEAKTREILITYNDSIVKFNILLKASNVKAKADLLYYWFGDEILHVNRGGYAGNLLDGKYLVFDRKMRLRTEGFYEQGVRTGIWKSWRESGELSSIIRWKDGLKNGKAQFFDNAGRLQKNCTYSNDLLDGTMIVFRGNNKAKIKFKDGIEIQKPHVKEQPTVRVVKKDKTSEKQSLVKDTTDRKSPNFFRKLFSKKNHSSEKGAMQTKSSISNANKGVTKDTISIQKNNNIFSKIFRKKSQSPKKTDKKQKDIGTENGTKEKELKVIKRN